MPSTTAPADRPPPPGMPPRPFRIFLASPGDVRHERQIVREVVEQVRMERRFRGRLALELIGWDQPGAALAMQAGVNPQKLIDDGLPQPRDCDLVITLFWGLFGTPLPSDCRKPDGSPYKSATEWEYRNALAAFRERGRPVVWLFRRLGAPPVRFDDPDLDRGLAQWRAVEGFFAEELNNPDGSIASGLNTYQAPDEFRTLLERLLRDHLECVVAALDQAAAPAHAAQDAVPAATPEAAPPAYRGEPYPGLAAFTPQQEAIFFGRGPEVDQLLALLADPRIRFAAVVGLSGAGKSSLVAAGLIPRLREGLIGGEPWLDCRCTPAERGRDPFLSLATALNALLPGDGGTVADLARDLQTDPARLGVAAAALLAGRPDGVELLLYIDQLEELFIQTDPALTPDFVALLTRAAALPRVRCLVTLRADFYGAACTQPGLAALLRRDRGTLPLDPPGRPAMAAMIARPARAVGLELEEGLIERILEDAGGSAAGPGALALTAFALHELYRLGGAAGRLTLGDYTVIGGIDGAVRRRAEETLARLGQVPDATLWGLFAHLVEVDEQGIAARRRAAKSDLPPGARPLADALTAARLLTAGRGADEAPTLELAHESLLRTWPRLAQWVSDCAESLRARRDLERAAAEWHAAGRPAAALRVGRPLKRYRSAPPPRSPLCVAYLGACARRVWRGRALGTLGLLLLAAGGFAWNFFNQPTGYPPSLMAKGLAVELGLGRLPGPLRLVQDPDLVAIPGGAFRMGDSVGDGFDNERPVHVRSVAPFELGRTEVTFDEYDLFAAATGRPRPGDAGWGRGQRPVINVSWEEASAYAAWLAEVTGRAWRLPSEAEWEYAARAGTTSARWYEQTEGPAADPCRFMNGQDRRFTQSDEADAVFKTIYDSLGLWNPLDCDDGFVHTAPVGRYAANPWGLHDMLGNVSEWMADCDYGYADAPKDGAAVTADSDVASKRCAFRVIRGGGWSFGAGGLRASFRYGPAAVLRDFSAGLRLARSP